MSLRNSSLFQLPVLNAVALMIVGVFVMFVGAANMYLGLAGMTVFTILLYVAMTRDPGTWTPNVRGENAYQILGVAQDADAATIRRAFRDLERTHHPDAVPDDRKADATALFIRISQAHELLGDEEKRYEYDHLLEMGEGVIPPFDEAYRQIKDVDKHPTFADYDAAFPAAPSPCSRVSVPLPEPAPAPEPTAPAEVELPESVREAMGLPPADGRTGQE